MHHDHILQKSPKVIHPTVTFLLQSQTLLPTLSQKFLPGTEQVSLCPSVRRSWSLSMRRSADLRNSISAGSWRVLQDWHGNQHQTDSLDFFHLPSSHGEFHDCPMELVRKEETKSFWQPTADIYGSTNKTKTHKSITKSYPTLHHNSSKYSEHLTNTLSSLSVD